MIATPPDMTERWILNGCDGPAPEPVKQAMIRHFIQRSGYKVFIETGTYRGEMTGFVASTFPDVRVFTVELSDHLHAFCAERFGNTPNVTALHGDSSTVLPSILADLNEPAIFWLDGHWSKGDTAMGRRWTPLVAEVFHILQHRDDRHVLLIDDVRIMKPPTYPTPAWLMEFIQLHWPHHRMGAMHDILRSWPQTLAI